jgi:uncharacterized protein (DUF58 family)
VTLRPTGRGASIGALGIAAVVSAYAFGTSALVPLGVGMIALPLLALALVAIARAGAQATRPAIVKGARAGDVVRVESGIERRGAHLRLDALVVQGAEPRMARAGTLLEASTGRETVRLARGIWDLPGPRLEITDALGLARATRVGADTERVIVPPRVVPLRWATVMTRADDARARRASPMGTDLDRVREYRAGDPLSHVHWAQTAKRGHLQTKVLAGQASSQAGFTLTLDARRECGEDPVAFEEAIVVTASLAHAALAAGVPLRLEIQGGDGQRSSVRPRRGLVIDQILAAARPGSIAGTPTRRRATDAAVHGSVLVTPRSDGLPDTDRDLATTILLDPGIAPDVSARDASPSRVLAARSADGLAALLGARSAGARAA